jgi:nucleoside 2-deoxyribosyltransferase
MRVYIAGPLFSSHERWYLEQIAHVLEQANFETFLPHRDAGLIDNAGLERRGDLFQADIQALENCDICVALLTGPDHDSGTSAELGYAYAKGKPCFGISDDFRWLNNMIWGICSEGQHIAPTVEELLPMIVMISPPMTED